MSEKKAKPKKWSERSFYDALNTEIEHYTSQMSSQAERLIGFAVLLFTIVQATQYSRQNSLSTIFPDVSGWFQSQGLQSSIVFEWFGVVFLFASIFVLLVFAFRTIFRFTIIGYLLTYVQLVSLEDAVSCKIPTVHDAIRHCTVDKLKKAKRKSFLFPSGWFIQEKEYVGWLVCFAAASLCIVGIVLVW
jgi:hypothetical protein